MPAQQRLRRPTWFYIPEVLRFRDKQIHAVLGVLSLDIVIWAYLMLSWIGEREVIDRS